MVILQYRQLILKSTKKHRKLTAKCASSFCVQKAVDNVDEGLTHSETHTDMICGRRQNKCFTSRNTPLAYLRPYLPALSSI